MLVSHGSTITQESEDDCAERWRAVYGIERGHALARVMQSSNTGPLRVYYRTVANILSQFVEPRRVQVELLKEKRSIKPRPRQQPTVDEMLEAFHANRKVSRV